MALTPEAGWLPLIELTKTATIVADRVVLADCGKQLCHYARLLGKMFTTYKAPVTGPYQAITATALPTFHSTPSLHLACPPTTGPTWRIVWPHVLLSWTADSADRIERCKLPNPLIAEFGRASSDFDPWEVRLHCLSSTGLQSFLRFDIKRHLSLVDLGTSTRRPVKFDFGSAPNLPRPKGNVPNIGAFGYPQRSTPLTEGSWLIANAVLVNEDTVSACKGIDGLPCHRFMFATRVGKVPASGRAVKLFDLGVTPFSPP